ncbi:TRADD-N-associated membrane domain-containing protein [Cellulosilyticum sp. WCF-2]|uniref:TRADD-N-associated membrane domain-containing protein n=1 Tax=Cellulosilyticum sp. WCF-2 TaxID=2497860 RepID=UPI000F8CF69D|nr:hypothetical protein [Cellulosilyticum sp. WCF-2]QEH70498.1 hypothetical protein EKH84_19670 [Cellulosilyticum sp. WCF-2]
MESITIGSNKLTNSNKSFSIQNNSLNTAIWGKYHNNELIQNNKIINTAIGVIIAGTTTIVISIFIAIFKSLDIALITAISGVLVDFISATIFWLVTKSNDSKMKYFLSISNEEERNNLIRLIQLSTDIKFQNKMIERLVNSYCKRAEDTSSQKTA